MKFFDYLIWCTCSSSSISEASPSDDFKALEPGSQSESHQNRNRRKCSNNNSSKSGSATADWRHSLKAISEDNIVPVMRRNSTGSESRTLKRKVSPMHKKSKVPTRRSQDYGSAPIPGIIPAFAPTPFLF